MTEAAELSAGVDPVQGRWERACSLDDLPVGGIVHVGSGGRLALIHRGGEFFAFVDLCPHAHLPVSSGWIDGGAIVCGHHGARFDLKTGVALDVTDQPLTMLPTRVSDGDVLIFIPPNMRF